MKYQVSCILSFINEPERDEAFTHLWNAKPLGLPGDTLSFGQFNGYHTLNCQYRYDTQNERDDTHAYLSGLNAIKTVPGRIEMHTCKHDTGEPCIDSVVNVWGDAL